MLSVLTHPSPTFAPRTFLVEYAGEGGSDGPGPGGPCSHHNTRGMECGVVGPDMKRMPPYYTGEPVCSCEDVRNNTYRCLRTIESDTSSFIYCEFFQGFWGEGGERGEGASFSSSSSSSSSSSTPSSSFPPLPPSFHAEYYSLPTDPWQLNNTIADLTPSQVDQLHSRLLTLATCAGVSCHGSDSSLVF